MISTKLLVVYVCYPSTARLGVISPSDVRLRGQSGMTRRSVTESSCQTTYILAGTVGWLTRHSVTTFYGRSIRNYVAVMYTYTLCRINLWLIIIMHLALRHWAHCCAPTASQQVCIRETLNTGRLLADENYTPSINRVSIPLLVSAYSRARFETPPSGTGISIETGF